MGQIIAIGGGGFGRNPNHLKIERYIIDQSLSDCPNVCFIPTASAENPDYIKNFNIAFHQLKCNTSILSLFSRTPDLEALIMSQDVIYVGGGNTKSMLAVWHDWGLIDLIKKAYKKGAILCGVSAGAICWFNKGVTDSWESELKIIDCLGLVNTNGCPHYNGESDRRPSVESFLRSSDLDSCICMEDGSAIHYVDGNIKTAINFQSGNVYNAFLSNNNFIEDKIKSIYL
tara:strand:+ start:52 stop:738 length:687 start_codon:yes stop_codon:yes gene_type:complete